MTTPVNTVVETHINAPRSVVFAVLADRQSYGDVLPISTRLVSPGADGGQGIGAVHFLGLGPVGAKERITELVPDQRMAYEVVGGLPARRHTGEVELADEGVGTKMTYRMVHEPALPAPGFVLRPVLVGLTKALAGAVKKESERRAR